MWGRRDNMSQECNSFSNAYNKAAQLDAKPRLRRASGATGLKRYMPKK